MYNKSYIKKWVGLFLLVFTIFFGINSNVYADENDKKDFYSTDEKTTEKCQKAVDSYKVNIDNQLLTKEKLRVKVNRSNDMDGNKTKFYVRVLPINPGHADIVKYYIKNYNKYNDDPKSKDYPYGYTDKISFEEIKDKNGKVTGYTTEATKNYSLAKLKELLNKDIEEFYILIYTNEGSCTKYFYALYHINYIDEPDIIGNVKPVYTDEERTGRIDEDYRNGHYCSMAQDLISSSADSNDTTLVNIVKKAMPSCFPDANGNVSYNITRSNLQKIADKLKTFYYEYIKFRESKNTSTELSPIDENVWKKVALT